MRENKQKLQIWFVKKLSHLHIHSPPPFFSSTPKDKNPKLVLHLIGYTRKQHSTQSTNRNHNQKILIFPFTSRKTFLSSLLKTSSKSHVLVAFCVVPRFLPSSPSHLHSLNSLLLPVSSFPQVPPITILISFVSFSTTQKVTIIHTNFKRTLPFCHRR